MKNFLLPLFFLFILSSCFVSKKKSPDIKATKAGKAFDSKEAAAKGYVKATVIDYSEIAGCTYLLMLENESKLQAKNMNDLFKKDGMEVWVKYKVEDEPTVCMAGKVVRIISIVSRK